MAVTSLTYAAFVLAALILYYLFPRKYQWLFLLIVSIGFYLCGGIRPFLYLLFASLVTYAAGVAIRITSDSVKLGSTAVRHLKKLWVAITVILNFGLLFAVKYWNFTADLISSFFGTNADRIYLDLIVPLGISFFMFQSVGYVIDVYRGKTNAQPNYFKFLLFVCYFPQLIQGPIGRYGQLSEQLFSPHEPNADNFRRGIQLMLWGYFKKLIIADRTAVLVNTVFGDSQAYGGAIVLVAVIFYCIQLYCDFSGGIDIIRGTSYLFGIELAENFKRPIFAASLTEFWQRWHITLGAWMRDYVFYPLSLSKPFIRLGKFTRKHIKGSAGKIIPTSIATFIVYFLIGIWHGANLKYIAFGFWNGLLITAALLLKPIFGKLKAKLKIKPDSTGLRVFGICRTAAIVVMGRYLTRSATLKEAVTLIARFFTFPVFRELHSRLVLRLGLSITDYVIIALGVLILFTVELKEELSGKDLYHLTKSLPGWLEFLLLFAGMTALLFLGFFSDSALSAEFIYAQF